LYQYRAGWTCCKEEGDNAIYKSIRDIGWFNTYKFDKVSDCSGPVKMSVTVIETENKAHNVIPSQCRFVVDCRVNELYSFEEMLNIIRSNVGSDVKPRSTRLRSSAIALDHPLVKAGIKIGKNLLRLTYYIRQSADVIPGFKDRPGR
jgi:acetylornithine deacetylase